jgi:isopenicillin N synthase-like dioxygenase
MDTRVWKKHEIEIALVMNKRFLFRSNQKLFELQTADEQNIEETLERNSIGYTKGDAKWLSEIAQSDMLEDYREYDWNELRDRMIKYAGQLTRLANGQI